VPNSAKTWLANLVPNSIAPVPWYAVKETHALAKRRHPGAEIRSIGWWRQPEEHRLYAHGSNRIRTTPMDARPEDHSKTAAGVMVHRVFVRFERASSILAI